MRIPLLSLLFIACSLLYGQDSVDFFNPYPEGYYETNVTRLVRTKGDDDTFMLRLQLIQHVNPENWRKDRVSVKQFYDGVPYLVTVQHFDTIFEKSNDSTFEYELLGGDNEVSMVFSPKGLVLHNLRHLQFLLDHYTLDTSINEHGTSVYKTGRSGDSIYYTYWHVFAGDSSIDHHQVHVRKIEKQEFQKRYEDDRSSMRYWKKYEPAAEKGIGEKEKRKSELVDSTIQWLQRFNITPNPIQRNQQGYTILYFYFDACLPCLYLKPVLADLSKNASISIVAVNTADEDTAMVLRNVSKHKLAHLPVVLSPDEAVSSFFHVSPVPTVIVFDSTGKELFRREGYTTELVEELKKLAK